MLLETECAHIIYILQKNGYRHKLDFHKLLRERAPHASLSLPISICFFVFCWFAVFFQTVCLHLVLVLFFIKQFCGVKWTGLN